MNLLTRGVPKQLITKLCGKPTPLGVGWIAHFVYVTLDNIHIL